MNTDNHDLQSATPTGRVLVLGTDDRVILAVARSLGRRGLTVHLGWCPPTSIAARSRYVSQIHHIPPYARENDQWKKVLVELLSREQFDLVIPCNDSTLVPLVANRDDFAVFPEIYLLPDHVFSIVSDKFNTYELASSLGVAIPQGRVIEGSDDPDELIREFGLPLVLKPQASITVENTALANVVQKVKTRADLINALQRLGSRRVLVQQNFVGRGVGVEMLVNQGKVLFAFQHARIHETVEWGSSYRKSVAVSPDLLEAASKLMHAVGYTGVAMAEFIVEPTSDRWVLLEINGRFWGSLPLAVAAGADFPRYLYEMMIEGKRAFVRKYRENVRCRNLHLDLGWMRSQTKNKRFGKLFAPLFVLGQLSLALLRRDRFDSFAMDDPRPQLVELRILAARAYRKILGMVHSRDSRTDRSRRSSQRQSGFGSVAVPKKAKMHGTA